MRLVLITDSGEQIEARCDGCRHWGEANIYAPDTDEAYCELGNCIGMTVTGDGGLLVTGSHGCALFDPKDPS